MTTTLRRTVVTITAGSTVAKVAPFSHHDDVFIVTDDTALHVHSLVGRLFTVSASVLPGATPLERAVQEWVNRQ